MIFSICVRKGKNVEYIVNGEGGNPRPYASNEKTIFCGSEPAFSLVSFKGDSIRVCFIGTKGNLIYNFGRSYKN